MYASRSSQHTFRRIHGHIPYPLVRELLILEENRQQCILDDRHIVVGFKG